MSDSEEEFASAGEEVDEKQSVTKEIEAKEEKKNSPELEDEKRVAPKDAAKEDKKEEGEAKKEVIQRQPAGGLTYTEEQKDPRSALDKFASKESPAGGSGGGWGFGGWGSSLLSTARSSVTAFTSQLGDGINSVVETVESALDVPPPEELALSDASVGDGETKEKKEAEEEEKKEAEEEEKKEAEEEEKKEEEKKEELKSEGSWWGVTSSVMSSAQQTTRNLMTGGLDVLETIGKKTMEALHETDPGLARTRGLLSAGGRVRPQGGATLSQSLREARERHEEAAEKEKRWEEERLGHFGAQFEECQGLAHLEALELLAMRCEAGLHSRLGQMSGEPLTSARQDLVRLKAVFERVEEEDEEEEEEEEEEKTQTADELWGEVESAIKGVQVSAKEEVRKTVKVKDELMEKALSVQSAEAAEEDKDDEDPEAKKSKEAAANAAVLQALQQAGVQLLAHATASWVGLFHKMGELALAGSLRWTEEDGTEVTNLLALTERIVDCSLLASRSIGGLGEDVATVMRKHSNETSRRLSTQLVSAVYLETGNSKSYVRDALLLLLPVLQLASLT